MTPEQIAKAKALAKCSFGVGSTAKRFVRDMAWNAEHHPELELSAGQNAFLCGLCWTYRIQLAEFVGGETLQRWLTEGRTFAPNRRDDAAKAHSVQDIRNWWTRGGHE